MSLLILSCISRSSSVSICDVVSCGDMSVLSVSMFVSSSVCSCVFCFLSFIIFFPLCRATCQVSSSVSVCVLSFCDVCFLFLVFFFSTVFYLFSCTGVGFGRLLLFLTVLAYVGTQLSDVCPNILQCLQYGVMQFCRMCPIC